MKPISGMPDSDWATKHSTTGWVFRFCRAAVSWGCEKQKAVALPCLLAKPKSWLPPRRPRKQFTSNASSSNSISMTTMS
eukprot:6865618-Prymnesium_polylepis.1